MVTVRALWIALLSLAAVEIAAERLPNLAISSNETIRYHTTRRDLERACGTRGVDACTDYVGRSFACRCVTARGHWHLTADVHLDLAIHLARRRFLPHEREHIEDVNASLQRFFAPFLEQTFTDRAACERVARTLSTPSLASDVIHDLLAASNERLGCAKKLPKRDQ